MSPEAVELWLSAGFHDLDRVNYFNDDMPLLHYCISRKIALTHTIMDHLEDQVNADWRGVLPLEYGGVTFA